jgi:amino-acid N-acetyltransferase
MHKDFVQWFRESSPYIHRFRGKTFVIAFSGRLIEERQLYSFVQDLALLNSLGIRLVIVHGASPQINNALKEHNIPAPWISGVRITAEDALEVVKKVIGSLRIDIESALSLGIANSPMEKSKLRVTSGNFVIARPLGVIEGVDYKFTGVVRSVDRESINRHLELGEIVLLSPLGYSVTGEVFNIPHPDVATHTALALKSYKLIFFIDGKGLFDESGHFIRELIVEEAEEYYKTHKKKLSHEMTKKLTCSLDACKNGVHRAHLVNRTGEGSLLKELFTRDGSGTMIASDTYANIRQARTDDIGGILRLIDPMEHKGTLIRRDRKKLEMNISQFYILEHDKTIVACSTFIPYYEEQMAEIGCLVVDPLEQNKGIGEDILLYIEKQAKKKGLKKIFVLSTQTVHWFLEQGYSISNFGELPEEKKINYDCRRNPKVLTKNL